MSNDSVIQNAVLLDMATELQLLHRTGLPEDVVAQTLRTLFNVTHTALGAARHPIIDGIVHSHGGVISAGAVPVLGRPERLDCYAAALAVGTAAHLDDFDDTHLATVIHPGAACLGAALAIGWTQGCTGSEVTAAVALGVETQLRAGLALTEAHYDAGWHITGTCGVLGAAVTAGLLAGLDESTLATAVALAASQTVGHREGFGSAVKPLNAGKAAANGVLAVLLAREGFTANDSAVHGDRGFLALLSASPAPQILSDKLGERWHLLDNTYKPYPCGIVSHPAIDAAIALHEACRGRTIERAELTCHPLVVELTGNPAPDNGLRARFSTVHGVAVGLLDGRAGLAQYTDQRSTATDVHELRGRITLRPEPGIRRAEAVLRLWFTDGGSVSEHVEHARGSLRRPLTDEELIEKGRALAAPSLGARAAAQLSAALWRLPDAPDLASLLTAATPEDGDD